VHELYAVGSSDGIYTCNDLLQRIQLRRSCNHLPRGLASGDIAALLACSTPQTRYFPSNDTQEKKLD
jgi:hypothetical protein